MPQRERARLHLLDWVGCVAGARLSPVGDIVRGLQSEGTLARAALLGNVLEMDDVHRTSILHPGPVVWPAALAVPSHRMDDILDAAIRGYEAMITIGATFDRRHYAHYHNTATAGVFGAAAATAAGIGCSDEQMVSALGLAGSVSGGVWQTRHEPVMGKQWHVAHAVATGRTAARYAQAGITGPRHVLEGAQGLYAATCDTPGMLTLADGWRMADVSFKPWGACRHAHPAIDAALALGRLDGEILVETYADALTFCDRPDPATVLEAKFSLQHAVAIVAARGVPKLEDFAPEAIAALASHRARVTVREAADFTARFPHHYGARVTAGGNSIERIDTLGDPERPLSTAGVIAKARTLMAWGGVEADADTAIALCLEGDDPAPLVALLDKWL